MISGEIECLSCYLVSTITCSSGEDFISVFVITRPVLYRVVPKSFP